MHPEAAGRGKSAGCRTNDSKTPMNDKALAQWGFIFNVLGKENLRKMLFKAAMHKNEEGRVVIEFDEDRAMEITEHVREMEKGLDP